MDYRVLTENIAISAHRSTTLINEIIHMTFPASPYSSDVSFVTGPLLLPFLLSSQYFAFATQLSTPETAS